MKRKIITILIATIICAICSALVETFIFNFKSLTLDSVNQSISEVPYFTTKTEDDKTVVTLDIDQHYINKLKINYATPSRVKYSIQYDYTGLYDNTTTESSPEDIFESALSESVTNIDKTVTSLSISYDSKDEVQIQNITIDNDFHFNFYRAIFIFLVLLTIFFFFYFYKQGFTTERLHVYFAVFCTLIGIMIIIAQPTATFYSWDDQIHFEQTIDWFGGTITYSNGEYNLSDANIANSIGRNAIDSAEEKTLQSDYLNSTINHDYIKNNSFLPSFDKIAYLPMALGYNLAKIIHLPFIACFQIGKIFNLLFYILLISYSIKIAKVGKRLLTIIALLPSNIFLASEYSYDPIVFVGIIVFLVNIVNLFVDNSKKLDFKTIFIMILSMTFVCSAKAVYAPLMLLTLFIPKDRFKNSKQSKIIKSGLASVSVMFLVSILLPVLSSSGASDARGGNTSASDQLSLILHYPFDYLSIFYNNAISMFSSKLFDAITLMNFSYLDSNRLYVGSNLFFILLFTIIFIFLTDNTNNKITLKQRSIGIISILIIIIFIWSALYLSFTPVGYTNINGVQSRYFLPLLFPLLLFIQPTKITSKINPKIYNTITLAVPLVISIIMIYTLILVPCSF